MATPSTDVDLVARLRAGDQAAFRDVVLRNQAAMVRFASGFVPSTAVAEEVVQDTWIAVIKGLDGFEGRSSLRTWMFRILANQARTRGERSVAPCRRPRWPTSCGMPKSRRCRWSGSPARPDEACGRSPWPAGAISPRTAYWRAKRSTRLRRR